MFLIYTKLAFLVKRYCSFTVLSANLALMCISWAIIKGSIIHNHRNNLGCICESVVRKVISGKYRIEKLSRQPSMVMDLMQEILCRLAHIETSSFALTYGKLQCAIVVMGKVIDYYMNLYVCLYHTPLA